MARGAPWRVQGALWIPNIPWSDYDYDQTAAENIPDDWEKVAPVAGTFTLNIRQGFDGHSGLNVFHSGNGTVNTIRSGRGLRGGVPMKRNVTGELGRLWMRGWYTLSIGGGGIALEPIVTFYNLDESLQYPNVFAPITLLSPSQWAEYTASLVVPLNATDIGFWPTHARLSFRFTAGASAATWGVGRFTTGWSLLDSAGGSTGYDELVCRPQVGSLEQGQHAFGQLVEMPSGGLRVVDRTAGAARTHLRAGFDLARINDKRIWDAAWELRSGRWTTRFATVSSLAPPVAQCPIVVHPNVYDDSASRLDGPQPQAFYAWLMDRPMWQPVVYLGNAWRGAVELQEAT